MNKRSLKYVLLLALLSPLWLHARDYSEEYAKDDTEDPKDRTEGLNRRIGTPVNWVIRDAGPPTSVVQSQGQSFYTWALSYSHTNPTYVQRFQWPLNRQSMIYGGDTVQYSCSVTFEVNSEGIIVSWSQRGNAC